MWEINKRKRSICQCLSLFFLPSLVVLQKRLSLWNLLHVSRAEEWWGNAAGRAHLFHQVINVQFEFIWMHSITALMLMAHGCEHQLCRSVIWLCFRLFSSIIYAIKKKPCIKIEVNRITLKFLMFWECLTCIVLNADNPLVHIFVQGVWGIRHVMKDFFLFSFFFFFCIFFFFLLIYLDELLKLLLSCHKRLLSEWTYRTKASDAKRWNRGISLHLNWACLYSSLFISPACLASACQCVWLFRCYVNVLFSQTQAVTLWASLCLHTDGISVLHPPSYIKFATGPL